MCQYFSIKPEAAFCQQFYRKIWLFSLKRVCQTIKYIHMVIEFNDLKNHDIQTYFIMTPSLYGKFNILNFVNLTVKIMNQINMILEWVSLEKITKLFTY